MRIQHNKINSNSKKYTYIIVGIVLLLAAGGAYTYAAYKKSWWPFPAQSSVNIDAQQDTENESPKNNNTTKKDESKADENTGKTSDQVPVNDKFIPTISVLEQSGNNVKFAASIKNSSSAGQCVVTFSNPNDRPVVKQFDATVKDGSAICGPIEVPALEFSYLGEWQVSLRYYVGTEQATTTGKVTIR